MQPLRLLETQQHFRRIILRPKRVLAQLKLQLVHPHLNQFLLKLLVAFVGLRVATAFFASIAGVWLYGQLGSRVAFFVDEDPKRVGTQLFGVPLPAEVLAVAVRRSAPAAVVLWARRGGIADPRLFARVSRGRQRSRLFACGPGWDPAALPDNVELLDGVASAVERIEYVLVGTERYK